MLETTHPIISMKDHVASEFTGNGMVEKLQRFQTFGTGASDAFRCLLKVSIHAFGDLVIET